MLCTPKEKLEDIIDNGLKMDIFAVEQSISLYKFISNQKEALNKERLGHLFGTIQLLLAKDSVLSLNKIYESNLKYDLKSIPAAIKLIEENLDKFEIKYRQELEEKLITLNLERKALWNLERKDLMCLTDSELTKIVCKELNERMPSKEEMKDIKCVRDKQLAHNESIDDTKVPSIYWEFLEKLLENAQTIVIVLGKHYTGKYYEINGKYVLSSDASEISRSLSRLLNKAGIVS
ncbi:hypothetical protein [Nostoc sp. MG11]|uniref:AbiU2 domain-containing protein n=1 Tax=Nostoc sp. MG11 TaxID=2721166 RepID=UPI0018687F4D|nr:hypothetical protein [Nostoc sp. MG11]